MAKISTRLTTANQVAQGKPMGGVKSEANMKGSTSRPNMVNAAQDRSLGVRHSRMSSRWVSSPRGVHFQASRATTAKTTTVISAFHQKFKSPVVDPRMNGTTAAMMKGANRRRVEGR